MESVLTITQHPPLASPSGQFMAGASGFAFPLGHYKSHPKPLQSSPNPTFLAHYSQENPGTQLSSKPNLEETRFKKGFYRRSAQNIINPVAEEHKAYYGSIADRQIEHSARRSEYLRNKDNANGYNLITGQTYSSYQEQKPGGRRSVPEPLSEWTMKRGKVALRESQARYHAPLGSGAKFEYRQNVLLNEGVFTKRCASIIEQGKADIPSFGIEDQFSKSDYISGKTLPGLSEARQPGLFTPSKVRGNPSGVPSIVENWTKNIDLNNKAMRGQL